MFGCPRSQKGAHRKVLDMGSVGVLARIFIPIRSEGAQAGVDTRRAPCGQRRHI